jgi:hypothetical protein
MEHNIRVFVSYSFTDMKEERSILCRLPQSFQNLQFVIHIIGLWTSLRGLENIQRDFSEQK